jgi:hypothetical protein
MVQVQDASKLLDEITEGTADIAGALHGLVEKADIPQKASQLAGLAKDVSKTTAETGRTAAEKVNVAGARGATPYVLGGIFAVLLLWFMLRRREDDST